MADINQIITLGVGTPSDIEHFVLIGLNADATPAPPPDAWRLIYVRKRDFTVRVALPERSDTAVTVVNADDTYTARNGDIYIARNGDTYIAHNTSQVYPREISVRKRDFTVRGKVNNG